MLSTRRCKNLFYTHLEYYFFTIIRWELAEAGSCISAYTTALYPKVSTFSWSVVHLSPASLFPPTLGHLLTLTSAAVTLKYLEHTLFPISRWKRSYLLLISLTLELKMRTVTAGGAQGGVSVHSGFSSLAMKTQMHCSLAMGFFYALSVEILSRSLSTPWERGFWGKGASCCCVNWRADLL